MRTVLFIHDLCEFKAGEVLEVEDQIACGAIAQGFAVPSVDAAQPHRAAPVEASEVVPVDQAPVPEQQPAPAPDVAPESVPADGAASEAPKAE